MEIGHGLKSCTKEIHVATMQIDGCNVHLIDTPGFDDTELKDSDILMSIAQYLQSPVRLSGIFYLHPINSRRMGGVATRNLDLLRCMVGQDNMKNVKLITTMWDDVEHDQGEKHLEELTRDFWNGVVAAGAQVDRCYDAARDGRRIIQSVLKTSSVTLQLQQEMEDGCRLPETTAGKSLMDRYDELQERYQADMKVLREQLAKASMDRDRQVELEKLHADKLQKQVDIAEQARKLLEADRKLQGKSRSSGSAD
ncbi:kinesin light chain [Colletotrichum limetticola]|uniref:Kinesin light chain n=1 Tax=Colletotrichum limetticola TaxID=1209924 RepID=A0ABQ9PJN5_9PEZI|nr:kinesin light chain [Colletotrichum limetticola]